MRLVFISSVTASTPLRTISTVTGSTLRPLARAALARLTITVFPPPELSGCRNRRAIARHQHGRRGVLLDQCRTADPVAGEKRRPAICRRIAKAAVEPNFAPAGEG